MCTKNKIIYYLLIITVWKYNYNKLDIKKNSYKVYLFINLYIYIYI